MATIATRSARNTTTLFKTEKIDGFDRSEAVLEAVWLDYEKSLDELEM